MLQKRNKCIVSPDSQVSKSKGYMDTSQGKHWLRGEGHYDMILGALNLEGWSDDCSQYVDMEVNTRFQKKVLQATIWKREAASHVNCRKVILRAAVGIHECAPNVIFTPLLN